MDGEQPAPVDPANPDAPQLNELGEPIEPPVETIPEEILEDMKNLWSVFDMQDTNRVPLSELYVIMRALDFDLNPEELKLCEK